MSILAKQEIDTGYDFKVNQVEVPHPTTEGKSGYFMNIREDNDEIMGWTTERYGLVNHADVLGRADEAFAARGIEVERKVIVTEGGRKMLCTINILARSAPEQFRYLPVKGIRAIPLQMFFFLVPKKKPSVFCDKSELRAPILMCDSAKEREKYVRLDDEKIFWSPHHLGVENLEKPPFLIDLYQYFIII